jgi:hypothetical protein
MSRVLGAHAIVDIPTRYASYWVELIMQEARAGGHEVRSLTGSAVTAQGLLSAVEGYQPDMVVFGGHGSPSEFLGAGYQVVLQACSNDQMMVGSRALFISCLTGQLLVPSMVRKGAVAAQGFVKEFIWMVDGGNNPASDPYAASFTRTLVEAAREIMRGGSWQDWYRTFTRVSDEEIQRWGNSSDPLAASVVFCLRNNRSAAVISGAGTLTEEGVVAEVGVPVLPLLLIGALIVG